MLIGTYLTAVSIQFWYPVLFYRPYFTNGKGNPNVELNMHLNTAVLYQKWKCGIIGWKFVWMELNKNKKQSTHCLLLQQHLQLDCSRAGLSSSSLNIEIIKVFHTKYKVVKCYFNIIAWWLSPNIFTSKPMCFKYLSKDKLHRFTPIRRNCESYYIYQIFLCSRSHYLLAMIYMYDEI